MNQLLMSPLMKPERIINSNTRMFMAVNTLFTIADSFTPNARIPIKSKMKKNNQFEHIHTGCFLLNMSVYGKS